VHSLLFGSTARGEAGRYSGIDLLIIVPDGSHRRKTDQLVYRHLFGFVIPVDVVVATPADIEKYKDSSGLIYRIALQEGKGL
jgi:predicted nucleotidyltransferase